MDTVRINEKDNVAVSLATGHKIALCDIEKGNDIIKYGYPIGYATEDIKEGDHVHSHNMKTKLGDLLSYEYSPELVDLKALEPFTIEAFLREDGEIGIRNDIWIVPTVGCVNSIAKMLSEKTGAICFSHPYGCSQLGDDMKITQLILKGLITHPNAGGVLVLGLGCENNNIPEMKKILGEVNKERIKFLSVQDCEDEIAEGTKLIEELKAIASQDKRTTVTASRLKIGLKCGGSDGFSGITANAVVGKVTDRICAMGGSCVLTEVPEMFGAELTLFKRCESKEVFDKSVKLINDFKQYFLSHGEPVGENPSPGNKAGGISTLEDKALGCTQKCGKSTVRAVLRYGDRIIKHGLNLLEAPGNDLVASTALAAAGCQMVLFTTGRGTPFGTFVPTMKISTNSGLAQRKPTWIDFNAGVLVEDKSWEEVASDFANYVISVASGELVNNEKKGYREIAIFKNGVTL